MLKEILLEIGFIEDMRANWGNEEVPQTFFHNSPYSRKYVLIRLTLPLAILQFAILWRHKSPSVISTGNLGLQLPVAIAKFSDLVIGYWLLPVGNRVS